MLERAQRDQRNTIAAIALGFEQIVAAIYRLRDRGVGLRLATRRHRRAASPHDCVPSLALQPIGFAQLGFRGTPDQDRFPILTIVQPVRVTDALSLGLPITAG
jgi:hypothetical protein